MPDRARRRRYRGDKTGRGDPSIVIDLLAGFRRVAVMGGGKTETPLYGGPDEARSAFEQKLRTATDPDDDHLDKLAMRSERE